MSTVRRMTYDPSGAGVTGVEALTFARLRRLNDRTSQRADFHVLALVDGGRGTVAVDFETYEVGQGDVIRVAPGAVHRWLDIAGLAGGLLLFTPEAPLAPQSRGAVTDEVAVRRLDPQSRRFVDAAHAHLLLELATKDVDRSPNVASLLLSALLARLDHDTSRSRPADSLFLRFARAVETHYRVHHEVTFYADLLGYSARSVTRAAQRDSGVTAKQVIVDRVVLEAKRLLAHDRVSAARCGAQLGFADPASFSVFFRDQVGTRPGAWQAAHPAFA